MPEERLSEIACSKCGEINRLPSLFCRKCGAKLDYAKSERALLHSGRSFGAALAGLVRWAATIAVVAVLGLAVWPVKHGAATGTEVDARRYAMERALLEDALDRGVGRTVNIGALDLNAFLARNVRDAGNEGGFSAHFRGAGVEFGEGTGSAWMEMERGPLSLSTDCRFGTAGGKPIVIGARFGHLPLPGLLGRLFVASRKDLWRVFAAERRILQNADALELHDGVLKVRTKGR